MPRLFLSIEMPPGYVLAFEALKDPALPARWTPPEQYHLTLHFIGDASEDRTQELREALSYVNGQSFDLELKGANAFPDPRRPRVLVVDTSLPPELESLHRSLGQALRKLGFETESRRFHPHVTLARLKDADRSEVEAFLHRTQAFTLEPFLVDRFYLYESILQRSGALHRPLQAYPLTAC